MPRHGPGPEKYEKIYKIRFLVPFLDRLGAGTKFVRAPALDRFAGMQLKILSDKELHTRMI